MGGYSYKVAVLAVLLCSVLLTPTRSDASAEDAVVQVNSVLTKRISEASSKADQYWFTSRSDQA